MIGLALSIFPWVAFAVFAVSISRVLKPDILDTATVFILTGTFGTLGYLLTVATVFFFKSFLAGLSLCVLIFGLGICTLIVCRTHRALQGVSEEKLHLTMGSNEKLTAALLWFTSLTLLAQQIYQILNIPMMGWDALSHWAPTAINFIDHLNKSPDQIFIYWNKHPPTISLVLAWAAWSQGFSGGLQLTFIPWLMLEIGVFLTVYGVSLAVAKSHIIGGIAALVSLALPLAENHYMLAGYTETFLGAVVISGIAIAITKPFPRSLNMSISVLIFSLCLAIKNIGLLYGAVPLLVWLAAEAYRQSKFIFYGLMVSATAVTILFFFRGFEVDTIVGLISYLPDREALYFGGRELNLQSVDIETIVTVTSNAYFINSSFNILITFYFISLFFCFLPDKGMRIERELTHRIVAVITGLLAILICSLYVDDGLRHALPGQDTGHSRFTLPAAQLFPLLIIFALARLSRIAIVDRVSDQSTERRER